MIHRKNISIKSIKKLDVFSKIPEPYIKQSAVGGTFSLIGFCIIIYLIYEETRYFLNSKLLFQFEPDVDIDAKLKMNIDITIAMPCRRIGADFIDPTHEYIADYEPLQEEDTWWELSPEQRLHFETLKFMNSYFREEYHAIHKLLWKSNKTALFGDPPKRTTLPPTPPDACRIYGSVHVNKVIGNFHIVSGKLLALPRNHVHLSAFISADYNFSHRINRFSFGEATPGIIHPLEGDEKVTNNSNVAYQYFVDVVPTDINLLFRKSKTYQYSVKNYERIIDHMKGTHDIPGIFFHYDTSSIKVTVTQQRDSVVQFLIKLCATVGGIYVTNGLISMLCQTIVEFVKNKYFSKSENKHMNILSKPEVSMNLVNVPAIDVNILLNKS